MNKCIRNGTLAALCECDTCKKKKKHLQIFPELTIKPAASTDHNEFFSV